MKKKINLGFIDKREAVFLAFCCFLCAFLILVFSPISLTERIFVAGGLSGIGFLFDFLFVFDKIRPTLKQFVELGDSEYD